MVLPKGIDIVSVGIGPLQLAENVIAKRLSTWQVEWQNRISQEMISGDIEAQRLYQQARARALVENIENLLLSIEAMRQQSGIELHKIVMMRLMDAVEAVSADRALTQVLPETEMKSLVSEVTSELRSALEIDKE